MIADLQRFIAEERPYWEELEAFLERVEAGPGERWDLAGLRRFFYLYQRTATDLSKVQTFASEPALQSYLEDLVARAYCEVHETRRKGGRFAPVRWFFQTFPQTVRRRWRALALAVAATLLGAAFGGGAVMVDPDAKEALMPFAHLQDDPSERVAWEERQETDRLSGRKTSFSSMLMTHNTRVSITTMAMGITYGIGTLILLFYNGVILGGVTLDYVSGGETVFLLGWLLPHGSVEIPAIIIAGQAGLVIAGALIGWGVRMPLKARLRAAGPDVVTLIFGVALLLVWAGVIEAFLSQYHEPTLPYAVKIAFGALQLGLLALFLGWSGRDASQDGEA